MLLIWVVHFLGWVDSSAYISVTALWYWRFALVNYALKSLNYRANVTFLYFSFLRQRRRNHYCRHYRCLHRPHVLLSAGNTLVRRGSLIFNKVRNDYSFFLLKARSIAVWVYSSWIPLDAPAFIHMPVLPWLGDPRLITLNVRFSTHGEMCDVLWVKLSHFHTPICCTYTYICVLYIYNGVNIHTS